MVKRGLSFSGRERHCVFLNKGDGTFADISAVSGLDLPDDGRGAARCDWDHDGDLDLWVSNRNAPAVRYFENSAGHNNNNGFVAIKLEGNQCNRDAIGARLRLVLHGGRQPLMRTLRAGEGFLSQSSKWLHFGIGDATGIEQLSITWPGGETETISGIEPKKFYHVAQGSSVGVEWSRTQTPQLADGLVDIPEVSTTAAITSLSRIAVPPLHYSDLAGKRVFLFGREERRRPILINLWATWCAPCIRELGELNARSADLERAGIDIVALCVDSVNEVSANMPPTSPSAVAKKLNLKYDVGIADHQLVDTLQMVHDLMFDIHVPLPLPCSFLVDAEGRLLVLYKGALDVDDLVADATSRSKLRGSDRRELTELSAGKWISNPRVLNFFDLSAGLFEHGYTDEALLYYQKYHKTFSNHPRTAHLMVLLGTALEGKGQYKDAAGAYRFGLQRTPNFTPALVALTHLLATCPDTALQNPSEAVKLAEQAVRTTNAADLTSLGALAVAFRAAGRSRDANAVRAEIEKLEKK